MLCVTSFPYISPSPIKSEPETESDDNESGVLQPCQN